MLRSSKLTTQQSWQSRICFLISENWSTPSLGFDRSFIVACSGSNILKKKYFDLPMSELGARYCFENIKGGFSCELIRGIPHRETGVAGWVGTELPVSKIRAGTNGCHLMVNDRNAGPLEPPTYIPNYLPPHLSLLPSHFTPLLLLHSDRKAGMVDQVRGKTNRGDLMVNGRHRHRAPF